MLEEIKGSKKDFALRFTFNLLRTLSSHGGSGAVLEVVVESILEALNVGLGVVVLVEDFLTTFSPFLHGEGFVEDAAEDERGSCKICHG
jgi:hypothetical protein